jgi:hypothetical protein
MLICDFFQPRERREEDERMRSEMKLLNGDVL